MEVLAGQQTAAGAAAELGVTRQTIYNWKAAFVAAGAAAIAPSAEGDDAEPGGDRTARAVETTVTAIVDRLRRTDPVELDIDVLEAIRTGAGLPVNRFCDLTGIPRRTYYSRRAATDGDAAPPSRLDAALAEVWAQHPEWGARRVHQHLHDVEGLDVSLATVKRRSRTRS